MIIELRENSIDQRKVNEIVGLLRKGEVIAIPTDTVYCFAVDASNKIAMQKLAKKKEDKLHRANLSLMCCSLSHLSEYTKSFDRQVFKVLNRALPGPFTFILEASKSVSKWFDGNKKEIGIRIPNNKIALAIIEELGTPLAVSSVHSEDEILEYENDPNQIYEAHNNFVAAVVDGGLGHLYASTIIDCTQGEITLIREGLGRLEDL